ncbi:hypothetical protein N2152v2_000109 [Parachlorella kessleri]
MRAVLFREFGGPRVLELSETHPKTTRRKGELLVEVHATSVNPVDCKTRRGDVPRMLVAKPKVLGGDVAGVVVEADQGSRFRPGTRVACLSDGFDFRKPYGSYAEFISVPERTVADLPGSISFEAGAALPLALDPLALKPGQRVLVHAGAGGVGSAAIQLAKARGLHVTTTCSTRNVEFVTKELGADVAIDYTRESFDVVCRDAPFDCVLDLVAGDYEARSLKVLKPTGTYVAFLARINVLALLKGLLLSSLRRGPRYRLVMVSPNGEQMRAAIAMEGKLRPIIDRVLPLAHASEAHEYVEKGHARGKVVLKVPGGDVAGIVVEADPESRFRPGARVVGLSDGVNSFKAYGSYADYITMPEQTVAELPESISFEAAAALPAVALTALQALDPLGLRPGQRVLIHAGAGGVGSAAIQIAKARGLHVTTTCSTRNVEFVTKELGADVAIDYRKEAFEQVCKDDPFDCVLDLVGGDYEPRSLKLVKPGGTFVSFLAKMNILAIIKGLLLSALGLGPRYKVITAGPSGEQMRAVVALVQEGKLKPIVDRVLPLEQAREAHEYVEQGHVRGKVVLKVADE